MEDAVDFLVFTDVFQDGRNGPDRLVRNAGKGIERSAALDIPENHDGRRSKLIYNNFRRFRDIGLGDIDGKHIQSPALQDFVNLLQLTGMGHHFAAAAECGQNSFCYVVLGGAQPSGSDDDVVA